MTHDHVQDNQILTFIVEPRTAEEVREHFGYSTHGMKNRLDSMHRRKLIKKILQIRGTPRMKYQRL